MSDFKSPNISLENQLTVLMDQYEKDLLKICFVYLQNISLERDLSRVFSAKHSTNSKRELTD